MADQLEEVIVTSTGKVMQGRELAPHPGAPTRSCWKSLRKHQWGQKKGWFSGLHWFAICAGCKRLKRTYHVNCDINCMTGNMG